MIEVIISLPPLECSPNARCHWSKKARAVKSQRTAAWVEGRRHKRHGVEALTMAKVSAAFYCGDRQRFSPALYYRPRDRQNAISALKGAIDGLVDAGILKADDHRHLEWGYVTLLRTKKEHGGRACVVLTIESMEATDAERT